MQNMECPPETQFVETTPNNETQYQQQFIQQTNNQSTFQGQNYPPQNMNLNPQPMYNVNPNQYEFRPSPQQNVKVPRYNEINYMKEQQLCNSSRKPIMFHCPYCYGYGMTQITYTMGCESFCCVALLCVTTCVCCLIPCFNKDCQNVNHFCYKCGQKVGESRYQSKQSDKAVDTEVKVAATVVEIALRLLIK